MKPHEMIDRLTESQSFAQFQDRLCSYAKDYPFSMQGQVLRTYLQNCKWLQDVDPILEFYSKRDNFRSLSHNGVAFFSYLGSVYDNEKFWIEVLTKEPRYSRLWFKKSETYISLEVIMR